MSSPGAWARTDVVMERVDHVLQLYGAWMALSRFSDVFLPD